MTPSITHPVTLDDYSNTRSSETSDVIVPRRPQLPLAARDVSSTAANVDDDSATTLTKHPKTGHAVRQTINASDWQGFRRYVSALYDNARDLKANAANCIDANDRSDLIVQIEEGLENLFGVKFGKNECLQRCVVAIQNVLLQVSWQQNHVDFIEDVAAFLKGRSHIDDSTVDHVYQIIASHSLDSFRGVLTK